MFIKMLLPLPVWDCESELRMCNSLFHIWVNFFYYLNTVMGSVDPRWSLGLAIQNATNLSLVLLPSAVGASSTNMGFFSESLFVEIEDKLMHLESIFSWAFMQLSTCSVCFDCPLPELFWSVVKNPCFAIAAIDHREHLQQSPERQVGWWLKVLLNVKCAISVCRASTVIKSSSWGSHCSKALSSGSSLCSSVKWSSLLSSCTLQWWTLSFFLSALLPGWSESTAACKGQLQNHSQLCAAWMLVRKQLKMYAVARGLHLLPSSNRVSSHVDSSLIHK